MATPPQIDDDEVGGTDHAASYKHNIHYFHVDTLRVNGEYGTGASGARGTSGETAGKGSALRGVKSARQSNGKSNGAVDSEGEPNGNDSDADGSPNKVNDQRTKFNLEPANDAEGEQLEKKDTKNGASHTQRILIRIGQEKLQRKPNSAENKPPPMKAEDAIISETKRAEFNSTAERVREEARRERLQEETQQEIQVEEIKREEPSVQGRKSSQAGSGVSSPQPRSPLSPITHIPQKSIFNEKGESETLGEEKKPLEKTDDKVEEDVQDMEDTSSTSSTSKQPKVDKDKLSPDKEKGKEASTDMVNSISFMLIICVLMLFVSFYF